jgi:hypothetical protein
MALVASAASRRHQSPSERAARNTLGPELIQQILGPLSEAEIDRIAFRSAGARYRGKMLRRAVERRGLDVADRLLRWTPGSRERLDAFRRSGQGVLLTTWHAGPTLGIWAGLAPLQISLLKFQVGERFAPPANWEVVDPDEQGNFRAPAMKRALKHLRGGGWVAIPADLYQWSGRAAFAPCLGRQVAFSNALTALAELSGSRIVPVFAQWDAEGRAIEVDVQPPLGETADSPGAREQGGGDLIAELARRVEVYLRDHLDEYDVFYATMFARHERAEAGHAEDPMSDSAQTS